MRRNNSVKIDRNRNSVLRRITKPVCLFGAALLPALPLLLAGCGAKQQAATSAADTKPVSIRLVDLFSPENVEAAAQAELPERTEWNFAEPPAEAASGETEDGDDGEDETDAGAAATLGWKARGGIKGLQISEGRLVGDATNNSPMLYVERTTGLDNADILHSIEVRMVASAGTNIAFTFQGSEKPNMPALMGPFGWRISTPLIAGEEMRTYTIRSAQTQKSSDLRHIFIKPTDAKDARFEIESVRLVFLKEHLAEIPAGVGWQGLAEIYSESIVAKAPVTSRITVTLPERPWLDLSVGTIENQPVTFTIGVREAGSGTEGGAETQIFVRTVTIPDRWEPARVELGAYAGREVTLSFSVSAAASGSIGFWGAPAIRNSVAPRAESRAAASQNPDPPQGVILIMADTLRSDHLNLYGYDRETAPVLSRLAAEGTLIRDCISQASWTKVASPSLVTGLYPTSHTVKGIADRLPNSATTLAEVYREAGYATLSLSSVPFTGQFSNMHQGYETLHESGSNTGDKSSKSAQVYVDRLLPWLDAHRDVPFFVFLHVFDPHDPFVPRPPYDKMWSDPSEREEHEADEKKVRPFITDPALRNFGMPNRKELVDAEIDVDKFITNFKSDYDGSIRGMDTEFGRVLERLEELGLDDKTLIVFVADHGEEFLEHGRTFHGHSIYGELVNVPLIFWRPGVVPAGGVVERTVQSIDVMPTLLELSSVAAPEGIQGKSLAPLIEAAASDDAAKSAAEAEWGRRPAISEKAAGTSMLAGTNGHWQSYSIVEDGWKLIHNTAHRRDDQPEFELFDHAKDPLNLINLADDQPEVVERLAKILADWLKVAESSKLKSDEEMVGEASAEDLKRLRSLGYLQ